MEPFWFLWLRFREAYDSAYDSELRFSLGRKRSYDSDSDYDCDDDDDITAACQVASVKETHIFRSLAKQDRVQSITPPIPTDKIAQVSKSATVYKVWQKFSTVQ